MILTPKNWHLIEYTPGSWTSLVAELQTVIVSSMIMSNVSTTTANISVRVGNGTNKLATIIPLKPVAPNSSFTLDLRSFNLMPGQTVDVLVDVAGAEFLVSGAIDTGIS